MSSGFDFSALSPLLEGGGTTRGRMGTLRELVRCEGGAGISRCKSGVESVPGFTAIAVCAGTMGFTWIAVAQAIFGFFRVLHPPTNRIPQLAKISAVRADSIL